MKYRITSYDNIRKILIAQVAFSNESFDSAREIPVSIQNISDLAEVERILYSGFIASLTPAQLGNFNPFLEAEVQDILNTTATMTISNADIFQVVATMDNAVSEISTQTNVIII